MRQKNLGHKGQVFRIRVGRQDADFISVAFKSGIWTADVVGNNHIKIFGGKLTPGMLKHVVGFCCKTDQYTTGFAFTETCQDVGIAFRDDPDALKQLLKGFDVTNLKKN